MDPAFPSEEQWSIINSEHCYCKFFLTVKKFIPYKEVTKCSF